MDENNKKDVVYEIKKDDTNKKSNFKTVKNSSKKEKKVKSNTSFGKTVLIPFVSGVVGCAIVVGTCFGIPSIKERILGNNNSSTGNSSNSNLSGYVSQTLLSNYSDTAVYAANKILPSVVGIKVEYNVNSMLSMFGSQGQSQTATATGSGIIISEDGYILTNNHIVSTDSSSSSSNNNSFYSVSKATKVTVTLFNDTTEYEAKIVGTDEQTDLAVIKIDKTGLTAAELGDSDSVQVGEFSMAIGNPLGMQSSVTAGMISAVNREVTDSDGKTYKLIQTDAAINSGNSGGALVNSKGQVIGVNTLKLSGTGIEGMGFAIPINSTKEIYSQLIQYNKVKRPYIGITGRDLDEQTAKANNLVTGVYVQSVEDFSSAQKADIRNGDVIIEADGQKITTMNELNDLKNKHSIGDEMKLKVYRNGSEKEITVTLGEQP